MKVLPDYLINFIPDIEDAIEELRLSVLDHAYELLKCLDIDELDSDIIRQKLELYDIKVSNMTKEWLPNGKFYRMYPSIKHNRTRLNAIKSIVQSGGQFEGLWSDNFVNTTGYDYKTIQLLRHYELKFPNDGYFYVSGDVHRNSDGSVESSALTALTEDIFIDHNLPAGYTYLYIPWPRPVYPTDSGCFYNVHMLAVDRLHYVNEDGDWENNKTDVPASTNYDWKDGTDTPWRTPYWFDYHYMNKLEHTDSSWPVLEDGKYYKYDGTHEVEVTDRPPKDATSYKLNANCTELADSNAVFPTNCSYYSVTKTSAPNRSRDAGIVPCINEFFIILNLANLPSDQSKLNNIKNTIKENLGYSDVHIDEILSPESIVEDNLVVLKSYTNKTFADYLMRRLNEQAGTTDYEDVESLFALYESYDGYYSLDEYYSVFENDKWCGPYRCDILQRDIVKFNNILGHIKTYKPVWSESSPIFGTSQSGYYNSINPSSPANNSLLYWFSTKQENNIISESPETIQYNDPPVSEITHTSYDRPTYGRLDPIYFYYYDAVSGSNEVLGSLKQFSLPTGSTYSPSNNYDLVDIFVDVNNAEEEVVNNNIRAADKCIVTGDLATGTPYLVVDSQFSSSYSNCFTYKTNTINRHRLWLSPDKTDVNLVATHFLYNYIGSEDIYVFSENTKNLNFTVLGIYDQNGNQVTGQVSLFLIVNNSKYSVLCVNETGETLTISYVDFAVDLVNEPAEESQLIPVYNQGTNVDRTSVYIPSLRLIDVGDGFISLDSFYANNWIMKKYRMFLYYGSEVVEVWYDDMSGIYSVNNTLFEDDSDTVIDSEIWSFENE